mgnify:CR=1 FL=1
MIVVTLGLKFFTKGMLSISAPLAVIEPLLGDDLDIASVNAAELIAVSGPQAALDALNLPGAR